LAFGTRLLCVVIAGDPGHDVDSVVVAQTGEYCLELLAEQWNVIGDDGSDDVEVNVEVGVGEDHSCSDDGTPGDFGVLALCLVETLEAASPRISIHR
jgi:hypothetical protein